jgi:putative copper export protein
MTPDTVSVVVRALGFVALLQATGAVYFLVLFGQKLTESTAGIGRLGVVAALVGIPLVVAHQSLEAARMAGEFAGTWDSDLLQRAWKSSSGAAHLLQAIGLLGVAVTLRRFGHLHQVSATLAATLAVLALLLTGHTSIHALRWLLAPLLAVHLLIVAFWFGALAPLYWVTQRESLDGAARTVARFSALAGWLVPGILVAGLALALVLLPDVSALQRPYGLLLIGKLSGFGLLLALAAYNKWRLTPALLAGAATALPALRRSIAIEYALLIAVLVLTAVMTAFFSPES